MRVAIINPEFYVYGGAERVIVKLANFMTDTGIKNFLITPKIPPDIASELTETRIIETETIEKTPPILHSVINRFDVVNPHNDPAQLTVFPRKVPTVWLCNEPPIQALMGGRLGDKEKEIVQNHVDIAVVADEYNRKRFMKLYGFEPKVNHYGVDWEFFAEGDPEPVIEKYGLEGKFTVLQVGMLTFTKNQVKTVSIFKKVKEKIPEAKLVLAGYDKSPYKPSVTSRVRTSGLRKDVVFTGAIPQRELRDLYHASNIVLAPIKPQGGWLSTFEAMAAGKPVIVSPEMTASPLIEENQIGVVTDDYAEKIVEVYEQPRSNYKGRTWVRENLSWEKFCWNMVGFFEEALG